MFGAAVKEDSQIGCDIGTHTHTYTHNIRYNHPSYNTKATHLFGPLSMKPCMRILSIASMMNAKVKTMSSMLMVKATEPAGSSSGVATLNREERGQN
jgi:hypothetical protein